MISRLEAENNTLGGAEIQRLKALHVFRVPTLIGPTNWYKPGLAHFSSHLLDAFCFECENVKVKQALMDHASSRSTLEIYSRARKGDKRAAQQRVMQMIFPEDLNSRELGNSEPVQAKSGFEWIN